MGAATKRLSNSNGNPQFPRFVPHGKNRTLVMNSELATLSRLALMGLNGNLPPIDIDTECRYPKELTIADLRAFYDREGLAKRIVEVYPEESWAMPPEIYETEDLDNTTNFETKWKDLDERLNILSNLQIADTVSGIGQFGGVLFGFDDGHPLDRPVFGIKADGSIDSRFSRNRNLLYIRPISQSNLTVKKLVSETSNPRYGLPESYSVSLLGMKDQATPVNPGAFISSPNMDAPTKDADVHWTRILHLADNCGESPWLGTPRMYDCYNRVWDIKKILGANGQGYWYSGIPSLSLETQTGVEDPDIDLDSIREDVQQFMLGLQKYLALQGMTAKPLNFEIAEPWAHVEAHIKLICIALGVPMRVFLGTEEAKLASSQDMRTWNKRLMKRQKSYINPFILQPFFERMFALGVLPRPKNLIINWPDLNAPTENDKATTAAKVTDALVKYIQGRVFVIMKPREFLINVLGFSVDVVNTVLKQANVKKMLADLDKFVKADVAPKPAPGSANGKKSLPKRTKKPASSDGAGPAR